MRILLITCIAACLQVFSLSVKAGDSTGIKVTVYQTPEQPIIRSNQKDTVVAGTPIDLRADNCKGNLSWQYFDDKGELRLKEIDRNSDKKPDMFIHYRNGVAVKTEVDVNYDGTDMRTVK